MKQNFLPNSTTDSLAALYQLDHNIFFSIPMVGKEGPHHHAARLFLYWNVITVRSVLIYGLVSDSFDVYRKSAHLLPRNGHSGNISTISERLIFLLWANISSVRPLQHSPRRLTHDPNKNECVISHVNPNRFIYLHDERNVQIWSDINE